MYSSAPANSSQSLVSSQATSKMSEAEQPYQASLTSTAPSEKVDSKGVRADIDTLRKAEYPQLQDKVYLDHAGTTLYAKSLIDAFSNDMLSNLYGNPHSESSPSVFAGKKIDAIRERTLQFCNADPKYWDLIFVANATAAIKLTAECFRDYARATQQPLWYGYHKDAHTSLVGARTMADEHHCFINDGAVEEWISSGRKGHKKHTQRLGLFAYPGQSNMTGRRFPLEWCSEIRASSKNKPTYTLLDAAALATTAPLDLMDPQTAPDLVALSFYKIFGFPNVGALLVQKSCSHIMERKKYFGGGTVDMVIAVNDTWHAKKESSLHDQLEDGTLPFTSIFALGHAMDVHKSLYGDSPMVNISQRTAALVRSLYLELSQLRHANGQQMVQVYKNEKSEYGNPRTQGATIALNILRADGTVVGYADVEREADASNIYVRSGSLCNPGGLATHLEWSPEQMRKAYSAGHRCSDPIQSVFGKPTGVVRVSLGAMSTKSDIDAFVEFVKSKYSDAICTKEVIQSVSKVSKVSAGSKVEVRIITTTQLEEKEGEGGHQQQQQQSFKRSLSRRISRMKQMFSCLMI